MIPWECLDRTTVPGNRWDLTLSRRGDEFSICVGTAELMNSRVHGSEDALADLVCDRLAGRPEARLLIGGLGMGFTTAAALRRLGPQGTVVVAELVPAVVTWNRGLLGHLTGHPLRDPRVAVRVTDVTELLRGASACYDAILLDVDNGPRGLTAEDNSWLYSPAGLRAAFRTLRPAGILAVWSASPDGTFARRMQHSGFSVEERTVRGRGRRGSHNIIWLATRP